MDIVKSLRRPGSSIEEREAADEIERLRQDVRDATDIIAKTLVMSGKEIERLRAECERLRNQLSVATAYARGSKNI